MSKKDIKTPTKKEEEDDSTAPLIRVRKRCDSYGFAVNPAIKVELDEAVDTNRFELYCLTYSAALR
jgi:hypothetical protein